MKYSLLIILFTLVPFQFFGQVQNQESYANSITALELKEKLYTYSSDEFEGRETGTKGLTIAINYLKEHYIDLEVPSAKADGSYFQNVPLKLIKTPKVSMSVKEQSFDYFQDFILFSKIINHFGKKITSTKMNELIDFLSKNPKLTSYQNKIVRNESLYKDILRDNVIN